AAARAPPPPLAPARARGAQATDRAVEEVEGPSLEALGQGAPGGGGAARQARVRGAGRRRGPDGAPIPPRGPHRRIRARPRSAQAARIPTPIRRRARAALAGAGLLLVALAGLDRNGQPVRRGRERAHPARVV